MEYAEFGMPQDMTLLTVNEMTVASQQEASAIAHLHCNDFAHCDIEPANILVISRSHTRTKISNFDLISNEDLKTRCGSAMFKAPELLEA